MSLLDDQLEQTSADTEIDRQKVSLSDALTRLTSDWIGCQILSSSSSLPPSLPSSLPPQATAEAKKTKKKRKSSSSSALSTKESVLCRQEFGDMLPDVAMFTYSDSAERATRKNSKQLLHAALVNGLAAQVDATTDNGEQTRVSSSSDEELQSVAESIEQTLFWNYFFSNEAVYYAKIQDLTQNLKRNAPHLLRQYTPELLCFVTTEALADGTQQQQWRQEYKQILAQKLKKRRRTKKGIFECPSCHEKNTDHYEQQTRSADEPATIFIECFDCNKHFRR